MFGRHHSVLRAVFGAAAAMAALTHGLLVSSQEARADLGGLPFEFDPNSLVSGDVVKAVVNLVGFSLQHRPYEPATPLGTQVGLDLSVEGTLVKIPDDFFSKLADAGFPLGQAIPSFPVAKLHLHKGFGDNFDLGGSGFYFMGNKIFGGDAKIVLVQGEEGPTWAIRFCYTYTDLGISEVNISTKTYSPQLLLSKQMEFADPYLGVGFEYATGAIDAKVPADMGLPPTPPGFPTPNIPPVHKTGIAYGGIVFGGVSLRVPRAGLRVTVEGAYNSAGTSTMGTKVGFTF